MSNSAIPTWLENADFELVDPGHPNSIAGTQWGVVPLVSGAGAETRGLDAPESSGMIMVLNMITDGGGDIVVTVAPSLVGYDEKLNETITFANPGEYAMFVSGSVEPLNVVAARHPVWNWNSGCSGHNI